MVDDHLFFSLFQNISPFLLIYGQNKTIFDWVTLAKCCPVNGRPAIQSLMTFNQASNIFTDDEVEYLYLERRVHTTHISSSVNSRLRVLPFIYSFSPSSLLMASLQSFLQQNELYHEFYQKMLRNLRLWKVSNSSCRRKNSRFIPRTSHIYIYLFQKIH